MKRLSLILLLVMAGVIIAACDSGGDGDPIINPPDEIVGSMAAEISGKAFEVDSVTARFVGSTLLVEGTDSTRRSMRIAIQNLDRPGTFSLGDALQIASASYLAAGVEYSSVGDSSGVVRITRLDSLATRGTFRFFGASVGGTQIAVEQGEFLAPFD